MAVSVVAFTPAIPNAHAGVNTPALFIQPSSQALAAAGSSVIYNVNVANMSTFAGWDIYVHSDPTILNPVSFALGTFMPAGFESIHCINNAGTSCDANDAPGIVHSGFASFGFASGSGTLFTITYTAVAGPGTRVNFPETSTGNTGLNSLFDVSGANVTGVPEVSGTYGTLVNPTSTSVTCGVSPVVVGSSLTCIATVTDTSSTPSTPTGTVAFATSGSGSFGGSPCNLAGSGPSSSCSATYSPTAVGTGTHTITATYSPDAAHTSSFGTTPVTVKAALAADFTSSPAAPSVGQAVTFTSTVSGGTTPYSYSWTFGDGGTSTAASPTHAYAAGGTFTVALTVTDASSPVQSKTASHTVTIAATLAADFTSSPAHPTIGGTVSFTSTVTGGTTPYSYSWTFGDGGTSTAANPTHAYATSGLFTVTLTVSDSSTPAQSKTASHSVTVAGPVSADFASSPSAPTAGQTVTFTSTVSGGTAPYTYSWTFGDGGTSSAANPTHAYATAGVFTVTLMVTDSSTPAQSATASHTVTVSGPLTADFTSSPVHPVIGGTVSFTSTVAGGTGPYSYSWTFGDGGTSTAASPTHAYTAAGTFTVTLTVTDSSTPVQSKTASHTVTVASALVASFTISPASPTIGQTVTFTSTVTGGTTPYVYAWTFGDGGSSNLPSPTHVYTAPGTYTVTLMVTDSSTPTQTRTASTPLTVTAPFAADFTFSPSSPNVGQTVTFTSTVSGGKTPYTYSWTFGDGGTSTAANPTHVYTAAGTFTVTLTVHDSSSPSQSKIVSHSVALAAPDFTITVSTASVGPLVPANASDGVGGTNAAPNATSTITVTALHGFTGTVTLTLTPSANLNAYLNVTSITLTSTKTVGGALLTVNSNFVGNYAVTVKGQSGTLSHSVSVSATVVDFNVNASPLSIGPLQPNQVGSTTVTVTGMNGITTSVSVSRNPGGTTGTLTLSTCSLTSTATTCSGTLTVSSDVPGVYQVVVDAISNVAVSGGDLGANTVTVDHQVVVTVIVKDFAISASPTTIGPQNAGATGTSMITVTALDGFTGTVSFTLTPSSTHVTASISPTSLTFTSGGATSLTATLSVSFNQLGTYSVIVNGTSAGYPFHSVRVHVVSPATVLVTPTTQGLAAPGSTVSYSVNVVSMPAFAGYDISVRTTNAVLSPNSIDTSASIIPGFFETVNCVNGGFDASGAAIPSGSPGNLNCGPTDGPGIAHSAGASIAGFAAGDGVLFTVNYIAGKIFTLSANPTSLGPLVPANASDGTGGTNAAPNATSTVNLGLLGFGTSVTVFNDAVLDPNGNAIAHNTQSANYGVSSGTINLTLTPSTGLNAYISQTSFTASGTATVTVNSNFVGNYNLVVTGTFGTLTSQSVTLTVTVVDFNVGASPLTVGPLRPNQVGSTSVSVTGLNGISTSVSVSRNPGGTTGTLTLSTCSLTSTVTTCTGTLTVSSDVAGVYLVLVDATANVNVNGGNLGANVVTVDHQVTVTVTVQDFAISASPSTIGPQGPGATGTSMITVTALEGFTGTIRFALTPSSTHVTASVSPTSLTFTSGGATSLTTTLSVSFDQIGTYAVLVNGSSTGYPSHAVRVHVISPATVLITPLTQGLATPGSTVSYSVSVVSMPTFAGYDISVQTNNAVLSPNTIDTSGSVIPGFFETVNCVNGGFDGHGNSIPLNAPGNLNCGSSDGPGVAHSAGSSTAGFASGDGLLFTINYIAGAADFSISASPSAVGNLGAGQTGTSTITISTVTPSSTALTIFNDVIFDTNGNSVAHNTQNANYGASSFTVFLSSAPSSGLTANISPTSVSLSSANPTATATLSFSASTNGNYNVFVSGSASGLPNAPTHSLTVTVQVTDFTVTASPSTIAPPFGVTSGSSTITVTGLNGFTGTVTLTLQPSSGLTASIAPTTITLNSGTTSGTATLQVSATQSGTYTVIVTGSSPSFQSRSTKVTVIIQVSDFKISASPNFFTGTSQNGKNKFSSTISITSVGSFSGTVNLSATSSPNSKVSLSFSATSVTVPSGGKVTSTLFISIGPHATAGTYTITVTGTSGSITHTTTITVIIPNKTIQINSISETNPLSVSASGGVQTFIVGLTNTGTTTQYVQVVISGVSTTGAHAFTAQSTAVAVAAGATVNITVQTPANTFTGADVGRTFNFQANAFFGSSPTTMTNVSQPSTGSFSVVA